jgi:molecular chaperone DnaK (HSP70)
MNHTPSLIIGIDFGTTNCTVTCTPIVPEDKLNCKLEQIGVSQVIDAQTIGKSFSLPSFLYYPLAEELKAGFATLPWDESESSLSVGVFARDRGAELPSRMISSAKSWLCHHGIDRREKILPLEAEDETERLSPLGACSEILRHIRDAWNFERKDVPFEEQLILITVPASFDPSARQLVQEAAEQAGYPEIILLEEPQAAFYAWLYEQREAWRKNLKVGDTILVIDVGGGTTDFSLISVDQEHGDLHLKRETVGSHLLLGGDNIDLALAHLAQGKFEEEGHLIDHWQFQSLVHQCRKAKEELLGEGQSDSFPVTLLGRGSSLIGGSITIELTRQEVASIVLEGFIPIVGPDEQSPMEKQMGIQQIGLPYVKDPRISCQLAKFLSLTGESDQPQADKFVIPTAVLFNGGTLKSPVIRKQLMVLLNNWATTLNKSVVHELEGADYDYAVSKGAAYYGLARQGNAVRIRGGISHSYFVGVEEAAPAVPGISPPLRAICIVPFGMEEGEERELDSNEFALILGEQATFRFFSHHTQTFADGTEPQVGTVVRNWKKELTELHPIETLLDKGDGDGKTVRVKLKSKVTELGVLELWCIDPDGRKWKLEFDIRQEPALTSPL